MHLPHELCADHAHVNFRTPHHTKECPCPPPDPPRPRHPGLAALGDPRQMRRVLFSSFLGSAVEFYDFLLYGTAAALVFGQLFFSDLDPGRSRRSPRSAPSPSATSSGPSVG